MSDPIERLIRLAEPRPTIAEERQERVFAAVEAEFEAMTARRTRRKQWGWIATAAAAVLLVVLGATIWRSSSGVDLPGPIATIEATSGKRSVAGTLAPGATVQSGDGRIALRLAGGHAIRLDHESELILHAPDRLTLNSGALYFDSGTSGEAAPVEILTPFGTVLDIGTRYELRLTAETLGVRVRDGHVRVVTDDAEFEAPRGVETRIDHDGNLSRRDTTAFGEDWAWTLDVLPPIAIDGRPLREFLEWAARESGRRLAFLDSELLVQASEIRMSGTIDGLTVDEALETLLTASGLTYRVDAGTLEIRQAGG